MIRFKSLRINSSSTLFAKYGLLALLIFCPLMSPGYIQSFDMPWGPFSPTQDIASNTSILYEVIRLMSYLTNGLIVQKIILLSVFILAGIGAHKVLVDGKPGVPNPSLPYIAGILYMFNPFTYTRLMAGQWLVLLGYALLPWAVASLWRLMQKPSVRTMLMALIWTAAIGLTSIHTVGFVILAAVVLFAISGKEYIKDRIKWCLALIAGWLGINALWIIPLLFHKSSTAAQISSFGSGQLHAFASTGSVLGSVPLSTLLLQGFWADPQGRYYLPSHLGWWWGIVVILLAGLVIKGSVKVIQTRDKLGMSLLILATIAWWLGMGIGSNWSAGTTNFLVNHLPFYRGYREPQKWLMLLALAYAYMAAVGTGWVSDVVGKHRPSLQLSAVYAAAFLPILYVPMLLWGAGGQLVSAQYPSDYSTVKRILDYSGTDTKVLVLPWHLYLPLSYAKRVVANPAGHYFSQDMIISDNLELAGVPPTESTKLYRLLDDQLLPQGPYRTDAVVQLAPYNIEYIMVLKEADYTRYTWLDKQSGLTLVQDSAHIALYELHKGKP